MPPTHRPASLPPPVLHLRGEREGRVRLALALAALGEAPPAVAAGGCALDPEPIGRLGRARFWRVALEAERAEGGGAYAVGDGPERRFALPPPGGALRIAYASCNGSEDEDVEGGVEPHRNALWARLGARHAEAPFHLLVMGGDQVYADGVWGLPSFAAWRGLSRRARLAAPFTEAMRREAEAFHLALYGAVLGAPEVARMLGSVPVLMMWDDHDIVDGWGSHPPEEEASPVMGGLFAAARRAFCLIQLGRDPDRPFPERAGPERADPGGGPRPGRTHLGWAGAYGPARIAVPDLRSGRTRARVMGPEGRAHLDAALDPAAPEGLPHALLVSSVPVVNADLSALERAVAPLQRLADLYQDDLRDQWMSYAHAREWRALMGRLLALARAGRTVTVVSGEIHLAAHGTAEAGGARVEQLTASGIAHPPPPPALGRAMSALARRPWTRRGVRLAMHPVAPDGRRYVAERNWLELELRPDGTREACLHAERSGALPLAPHGGR